VFLQAEEAIKKQGTFTANHESAHESCGRSGGSTGRGQGSLRLSLPQKEGEAVSCTAAGMPQEGVASHRDEHKATFHVLL